MAQGLSLDIGIEFVCGASRVISLQCEAQFARAHDGSG